MSLINFGDTNLEQRDGDDTVYFLLYEDGRCKDPPYAVTHAEYKRRFAGGCFGVGQGSYHSIFPYRTDAKFYTFGQGDHGGCVSVFGGYSANYCNWWDIPGGQRDITGARVPHGEA